MQQPILDSTSTTALWQHGVRTFLRELDALVMAGRIHPDARNVVCWTLRQAVPEIECDQEGRDTIRLRV
jgi:hypothetical protein